MGGNGAEGTSTAAGQVAVSTDKPQYAASDTIVVTIANGLSTGIQAADHQSNCTVVTLERQSGASWQPQNPCRSMIATRLIPFGPGTVTTVSLQPQGTGAPPAWVPGTYRVVFTYMMGTPTTGGTSIISASFAIG